MRIVKLSDAVFFIYHVIFLVTLSAGCAKQKVSVDTSKNVPEAKTDLSESKVNRQVVAERNIVVRQTRRDLQEAIKIKEYEKALKITNDYLNTNPGDAEAYATRGNIYYLQGKCDEAILDIGKASLMGSTSTTIAGIKALCLAETGEYRSALESVNRSLKSKRDASLYNVRAYIYNKKGSFSKALKDCDKAIALDGSKPNPYKNKGLAYLGKARYEKAIEQFNRAIEINPAYEPAYAGRGDTYLKMGKAEKAVSDFKKACELGDRASCSKVK